MKKILLLGLLFVSLGSACVSSNPNKQSSTIQGQAGRVLPKSGIIVDANYDHRLDDLIEGYKLLPVSIRNVSLQGVSMDVRHDRWVIVSDKGRKYKALNTLKHKDAKLWRSLPEKVRAAIDYPEVLPINYGVTFDLLLPRTADLLYFKQIRYYNAAMKKEFIIEKDH